MSLYTVTLNVVVLIDTDADAGKLDPVVDAIADTLAEAIGDTAGAEYDGTEVVDWSISRMFVMRPPPPSGGALGQLLSWPSKGRDHAG